MANNKVIAPILPDHNLYDVFDKELDPDTFLYRLWKPQMHGFHRFIMMVKLDPDTASRLTSGTEYSYLVLSFLVRYFSVDKKKGIYIPDYSKSAESRVVLTGCDDFHYGAWLPESNYSEFYLTWEKLLQFSRDMRFEQEGFNGDLFIDFCSGNLKATTIDYN